MYSAHHPLIAQLREERLSRGWTYDNIARRLGTGKSTVSNWEHRSRAPRVDQVAAYAAALGLELVLVPKTPQTPHHPEGRNTQQ